MSNLGKAFNPDCSGKCILCKNMDGCMAGPGDNDFVLASKETLIERHGFIDLSYEDLDRIADVLWLVFDHDVAID